MAAVDVKAGKEAVTTSQDAPSRTTEDDAAASDMKATLKAALISPEYAQSIPVQQTTAHEKREYVVDSMVYHDKLNVVWRYQVRWCGYSPMGDTMEPS